RRLVSTQRCAGRLDEGLSARLEGGFRVWGGFGHELARSGGAETGWVLGAGRRNGAAEFVGGIAVERELPDDRRAAVHGSAASVEHAAHGPACGGAAVPVVGDLVEDDVVAGHGRGDG